MSLGARIDELTNALDEVDALLGRQPAVFVDYDGTLTTAPRTR